jgi:hypothetical protein
MQNHIHAFTDFEGVMVMELDGKLVIRVPRVYPPYPPPRRQKYTPLLVAIFGHTEAVWLLTEDFNGLG